MHSRPEGPIEGLDHPLRKLRNEEIGDIQTLQRKYPPAKSIVSPVREETTVKMVRFPGMDKEKAEETLGLIWNLALRAHCLGFFMKALSIYRSEFLYTPTSKKPFMAIRMNSMITKQITRMTRKKGQDKQEAKEDMVDMERARERRKALMRNLGRSLPLELDPTRDSFTNPFYPKRTQGMSDEDYFKGLVKDPARSIDLSKALKIPKRKWDHKMVYLAYLWKILELYPNGTRDAMMENSIGIPPVLTTALARLTLMLDRVRDGFIDE